MLHDYGFIETGMFDGCTSWRQDDASCHCATTHLRNVAHPEADATAEGLSEHCFADHETRSNTRPRPSVRPRETVTLA
ncbi:MAG: hypothetical protein CMJ48_02895 [Planctomycetaceae bacterium]|nr:hypothetical protein [Planctomycetaceae bacterium]